jgi:hypothetical protein
MYFTDDSLFPENMRPLVITAAPYAPAWLPGDASDIAVTWDEQVQAAVDCYNAGATVLHEGSDGRDGNWNRCVKGSAGRGGSSYRREPNLQTHRRGDRRSHRPARSLRACLKRLLHAGWLHDSRHHLQLVW